MRHLLCAALAALALLAAAPAAAEEVIRTFASTVFIQKDGTLDVTERIRVNAENVAINHGIYRDFPTRYSTPRGGRMNVRFQLIQTRMDGRPVENSVERLSNGVRIKLGSAERYVSRGVHDYLINYRVTRQIGFFENFDELYWNVTGNDWKFPIEQAGIQVNLPEAVPFGQRAFYSGAQGSTEHAAHVAEERPGSITIIADRPLAPREGLTVAVAFPKGVVDPPSETQMIGWRLLDMLPMVVAGLTLAAVIGFLVYAWRMAGRDPPEGTIVPLFAPPDDLSPAAMRYVLEQKMDNRAFAAALVEAGVKGHVILGEEGGLLGFGRKKYIEGTTTPRGPLPAAEHSAISALISPGERLNLDNEHHATFSAAKARLEEAFKARFDDKAFKRNHAWAGAAVAVWLAGAYLTALALVVQGGATPAWAVLTPLIAAPLSFGLYRAAKSSGSGTGSCALNIGALLLGLVAAGLAVMTVVDALGTLRWQPIVLVLLGLPIALSSLFWISAPTRSGREMLDRIAGFRQYLSITERDRLDRMQAPRDTLQMFERWLPYAIALGVENRWADRFAGQLAAAQAAGQTGFGWYAGANSPWTDTDGFVKSVGSSLSSTVSSASTAPGSSSGSGGGGSSGGGGGGGGGGGW